MNASMVSRCVGRLCWALGCGALLIPASLAAQPADPETTPETPGAAAPSAAAGTTQPPAEGGSGFPGGGFGPAIGGPSTGGDRLAPLGETLEAALRRNPDLRVAEAKLREAEAELNRTRLEVTQKVISLRHAWQTQEKLVEKMREHVERLQQQVERVQEIVKVGQASATTLDQALAALKEAEVELIREEAKLAELEATAPYLLGEPPRAFGPVSTPPDEGQPAIPGAAQLGAAAANSGAMTRAGLAAAFTPDGVLLTSRATTTTRESIEAALRSPTQLEFVETPLADGLEYLSDLHGLRFMIDDQHFEEPQKLGSDMAVNIEIDKVSLAAALQALEDKYRGLRFVVREYGILVTAKGREPGAEIGTAAPGVQEFLQQRENERAMQGMPGGYGGGMMGGGFGGGGGGFY